MPFLPSPHGYCGSDLIRAEDRVVGVRADGPDGPHDFPADLVVGTDGRYSTVRKRGAFTELMSPVKHSKKPWLTHGPKPYLTWLPDRYKFWGRIGRFLSSPSFHSHTFFLRHGLLGPPSPQATAEIKSKTRACTWQG